MIQTLTNDDWLPPIVIGQNEDGDFQLEDGHHRLVAYWLAGRTWLEEGEFILVQKDQWKPRVGKIELLLTEFK